MATPSRTTPLSAALLALLGLLALLALAPTAHAQNVTLAPSYSITRIAGAPLISLPSPRSIEGSNDNIDTVPIGFPFSFYGNPYNTIQVSSNGDIQFGTANATFAPRRIPIVTSIAPYLAFFHTDLYPIDDFAKTYDSFGSYPNRMFVLRLTNVPYTSTQGGISTQPSVSIDVVLFETDFRIEVRYVRVDLSTQLVTIGCEGPNTVRADGQVDFTVFYNLMPANATTVLTLQNSTLVFNLTTPIARYPVILPSSYLLTRLPLTAPLIDLTGSSTTLTFTLDDATQTVPIGFNFSFYGRSYSSVAVSTNGNLQFNSAPSTSYLPGTLPTGNTALMPLIAFYFADMDLGGSISYGTVGVPGSRTFVTRFTDVPHYPASTSTAFVSVDVVLYETSNDIRLRYYRVLPTTSTVLIGIQGSSSPRIDNTYDFIAINNAAALSTMIGFNGGSLNYTELYFSAAPFVALNTSLPAVVPETYRESIVAATLPRPSLPAATLRTPTLAFPNATLSPPNVALFRTPFSVLFFGTRYPLLRVSRNGFILFDLAATALPSAPTAMPLTANLPLLAFAFTPMLNTSGTVSTATSGAYPSREFVIRIDDLRYAANTSAGVSVDVRFFENTGAITLSYYRLDPTTSTVLIGAQASSARRTDFTYDFVSPLNAGPITPLAQAQLLNRAVTMQATTAIATPPTDAAPPTITTVGTPFYNATFTPTVVDRPVLSAPQTFTFSSTDTAVSNISLGMPFSFYGTWYSSLVVSTNGYASFTSTTSLVLGTAFPLSTIGAAIAPFLYDLNRVDINMMQYQVLGDAPNRMFILRFNGLRSFSSSPIATVDADTVLYEATGVIEYRYYTFGSFGSTSALGITFNSTIYTALWSGTFGAAGAQAYSLSTVRFTPVTPPVFPGSSAAPAAVPSSSAAAAPSSSAAVAPSSSVVVPSSSVVVPSSSAVLSSSAARPSSSAAIAPSSSAALASSSAAAGTTASVTSSTAGVAANATTGATSSTRAATAALSSSSSSSSSPSIVTPPLDAASSSSSSLSSGAIAGVVIGVVAGVAILIALFVLFRSRASKSSSRGGSGGNGGGNGGASERNSRDASTDDIELQEV